MDILQGQHVSCSYLVLCPTISDLSANYTWELPRNWPETATLFSVCFFACHLEVISQCHKLLKLNCN